MISSFRYALATLSLFTFGFGILITRLSTARPANAVHLADDGCGGWRLCEAGSEFVSTLAVWSTAGV